MKLSKRSALKAMAASLAFPSIGLAKTQDVPDFNFDDLFCILPYCEATKNRAMKCTGIINNQEYIKNYRPGEKFYIFDNAHGENFEDLLYTLPIDKMGDEVYNFIGGPLSKQEYKMSWRQYRNLQRSMKTSKEIVIAISKDRRPIKVSQENGKWHLTFEQGSVLVTKI